MSSRNSTLKKAAAGNSKQQSNVKNSKYETEEARLASFRKWPLPKSCKANPINLARAGFFHESEGANAAKCFHCGKCLEGFEPNDDPIQEHLSHASYCTFIQSLVASMESKAHNSSTTNNKSKSRQAIADGQPSQKNDSITQQDENTSEALLNSKPVKVSSLKGSSKQKSEQSEQSEQPEQPGKTGKKKSKKEREEKPEEVREQSASTEEIASDTTSAAETIPEKSDIIPEKSDIIAEQNESESSEGDTTMVMDTDMTVEEFFKQECERQLAQLTKNAEAKIEMFLQQAKAARSLLIEQFP